MKKIILRLLFCIFVIQNIFLIILFFFYFQKISIIKVEESNKMNKDLSKTIVINIKSNNKEQLYCSINNKNNWKKSYNNKCKFKVYTGKYTFYIKNSRKMIKISKKFNINEAESLKIDNSLYYMATQEQFQLNLFMKNINYNTIFKWYSSNENIATVDKGLVSGLSSGTTDIGIIINNKKYIFSTIMISDLITYPIINNNKEIIPCKYYNEEQAKQLDNILSNKIYMKGEGTRAAVIEASRFIPLYLKYKIPYFFENGRLKPYDRMNYVDGEGRYYHKGLYLSESKINNIKSSFAGPSIWGCPLTNYDTSYGWTFGGKYPNGLDCSGYISWVLYNGGIDIGDIGSGITQGQDDISDLGEIHELTYEYANSLDYKVGDIIARDGHTAIISGIDDENIYISESLLKGVVIEKFSYKDKTSKLYKLYGYISKMDKIYKYDGEYKNMW